MLWEFGMWARDLSQICMGDRQGAKCWGRLTREHSEPPGMDGTEPHAKQGAELVQSCRLSTLPTQLRAGGL